MANKRTSSSWILAQVLLSNSPSESTLMSIISTILAILIIALATGLIFLWAGITGELMIDSLSNNESIRVFTFIGLGLGVVIGCIGVWLYERKKDD